jgi:hypothetical protein
MALSKVNFNSMNVTPSASKAVKFNSSNNGLETGDISGSLVLISEQTASSSSTIDFTSGIDSTYKEYVFKFIDIHPATNDVNFLFQANTSGGSGFNETITTTYFRAYHQEDDGSASLSYDTSKDQAQGTAYQILSANLGNGNDECGSGTLQIFNPSSTTFVKHFICTTGNYHSNAAERNEYTAGYFNTTSAIDEIQFKMSSGNIDAGTIKMYGVK